MAENKEIKFTLNLDAAQFTEAGLKAKGVIESLSSEDTLSGLIEGLTHTTLLLGTVGAAAFAFKEAIDLTLEAEQIQKIESSFQTLAAQAGLSATELKEGMEKASAGLLDTTDILETVNKSLVTMGSSAAKLPEIMELARKATVVYGGDLKANFDGITTAINNGNARMLKQYGIIIDSQKAIQDYAKANNIAVNEISEMGKRQAILNQALEKGQQAFKGVNDDLGSTTSILQSLKATVADIGETFILYFDQKAGPTIRNFLSGVKDVAKEVQNYVQATFGTGMTQTTAQITQTENQLQQLKGSLVDLEFGTGEQGFFSKLFHGSKDDQIAKINAEISQTTAKLDDLRKKNSELSDEQAAREAKRGGGSSGDADNSAVNQKVHLENEQKFRAELLKIQKEYLVQEQLNVQTFDQIDENVKQQNLVSEEEYQNKLNEIRNNQNLNDRQREDLLQASKITHEMQLITIARQNDDLRRKMLDSYVKNATSAMDGISRAFKSNATKMKMDLTDFNKRGQEVWQSFATNSTNAFQTMGQQMAQGANIAKAAADAIKSLFLNMLADRAIAEGQMLLLSGIWPPNPLAIGAGAGLIALGGALKSVAGSAGGGSSEVSASSGGGGGGGATDYGPIGDKATQKDTSAAQSDQVEMAQAQRVQRSVNIQIAGNYFETDASRRQLMEMMRQESDATDFAYNQIGV